MRYRPVSSASAVRAAPVARFSTVTLAPTTARPCGSSTWPDKSAVFTCAQAAPPLISTSPTARTSRRIRLERRIFLLPTRLVLIYQESQARPATPRGSADLGCVAPTLVPVWLAFTPGLASFQPKSSPFVRLALFGTWEGLDSRSSGAGLIAGRKGRVKRQAETIAGAIPTCSKALRPLVGWSCAFDFRWRMNGREWKMARWLLAMEPADQAAQFLAVFLFHVDELDAAARGLDVSHHRSRVNATQAGAAFYTDGLAHAEPSVRLQKCSAQAKGVDAGRRGLGAFDFRRERSRERNRQVASRPRESEAGFFERLVIGAKMGRGGKVFDQGQSFLSRRAQAGGLSVRKSVAQAYEIAEQRSRLLGAHPPQRFDGLDANEDVLQPRDLPRSDFQQQRHRGRFLCQADLVEHHRHHQGMRLGHGAQERAARALHPQARQFRDGQILQAPIPTRQGLGQGVQQTRRLSRGEQLHGRGGALVPRL